MALNVLIVDDSSVMRAMVLKTMRMAGISLGEVHQASNGQEGLDALAEQWIDLVLVDINMPVMDGEEMIDRMKERPETADVPILVISTEGSETRIERLRQKGAFFIQKPFAPETVRDMIQTILGSGVTDA